MDIDRLLEMPGDPMIVIDGYHGFMARPTDLSHLASRAFYMAGGYKYAMAGEGACFMHCPPGLAPRPRDTGWFAAFGNLSGVQAGKVAYSDDGWRFMGSTFDPSGLYRFNAVMRWLDDEGIVVGTIHDHALALQDRFLALASPRLGPDIREPSGTVAPGKFPVARTTGCGRGPPAAEVPQRRHGHAWSTPAHRVRTIPDAG